MQNADHYLARWQSAGLLDEPTAEAIRAYEAGQEKPAGRQWQVLLALILGGILLGAGVLLFVAAHWENISPLSRMGLVLGMLVFFHGLALLTADRFSGFATAMHALGTVSSGAAIALIGQIFNMQEHWPAAILVWAACAGAGWVILRDQFQETLTLLLIPAWIVCEFSWQLQPYTGSSIYLARLLAVLAAAYLSAFLRTGQRAVFGILFGVGAVMLPIATGILVEGWRAPYLFNHWGDVPFFWRFATVVAILCIAAISIFVERWSAVPIALAAILGYALPWAQTTLNGDTFNGRAYTYTGPSLLAYALVAAASVALVAWGVHIASKALVNYGIAAFAVSVMWFYFSDILGKLDRSLGLILLGVLFLAGGWALERTRRKLVGDMDGGLA
jgi:uncharacterized membrane protein